MVSKKEWLEKVLIDLKGKPMDGLNFESGIGQTYTPFFHLEDQANISTPSYEAGDITIAETIEVTDPNQANTHLKHILSRGVNAPRFILPKGISATDFSTLLEGVNLDFLAPIFEYDQEDSKVILDYLHENVQDKSAFKGGVKVNQGLLDIESHTWPLLKTNFIQSSATELKDVTLDIVQQLVQLYTWAEPSTHADLHKHTAIELELSNDFYSSVCHLRALKLLFAHVLKSFDLDHNVPFHITVKHVVKTAQTEGLMLIQTAHHSMMGYLGGASSIDLTIGQDALDKHDAAFLTHVSRNMHHVLNYESQLDAVQDPTLGSYAFDEMTVDIAQSIWEKIG